MNTKQFRFDEVYEHYTNLCSIIESIEKIKPKDKIEKEIKRLYLFDLNAATDRLSESDEMFDFIKKNKNNISEIERYFFEGKSFYDEPNDLPDIKIDLSEYIKGNKNDRH